MNLDKKFCRKCELYLSVSKFKKLTSVQALKKYPDGYYWCCVDCFKKIEWRVNEDYKPNRKMRRRMKRQRSISQIERKYGLTEDAHKARIAEQDNKCAICGNKDEGKVLCVDHDHKTGEVRGLLCGNCNIGLGNMKDDIQILKSAIGYLEKCSTRRGTP